MDKTKRSNCRALSDALGSGGQPACGATSPPFWEGADSQRAEPATVPCRCTAQWPVPRYRQLRRSRGRARPACPRRPPGPQLAPTAWRETRQRRRQHHHRQLRRLRVGAMSACPRRPPGPGLLRAEADRAEGRDRAEAAAASAAAFSELKRSRGSLGCGLGCGLLDPLQPRRGLL